LRPERYPETLQEDFKLRRYREKLGRLANNAGISEVRIERKADQIRLEVHSRPGVVVGREVLGLSHCELDFRNYWGNRQIRINVVEVAQVDAMRTC